MSRKAYRSFVTQQIMDYLNKSSVSRNVSDIKDAIGVSRKMIGEILDEGVKAGTIKRHYRGQRDYFAIPTAEEVAEYNAKQMLNAEKDLENELAQVLGFTSEQTYDEGLTMLTKLDIRVALLGAIKSGKIVLA